MGLNCRAGNTDDAVVKTFGLRLALSGHWQAHSCMNCLCTGMQRTLTILFLWAPASCVTCFVPLWPRTRDRRHWTKRRMYARGGRVARDKVHCGLLLCIATPPQLRYPCKRTKPCNGRAIDAEPVR